MGVAPTNGSHPPPQRSRPGHSEDSTPLTDRLADPGGCRASASFSVPAGSSVPVGRYVSVGFSASASAGASAFSGSTARSGSVAA